MCKIIKSLCFIVAFPFILYFGMFLLYDSFQVEVFNLRSFLYYSKQRRISKKNCCCNILKCQICSVVIFGLWFIFNFIISHIFFVLLLVIEIFFGSRALSILLIANLMKKGFNIDKDSYEDTLNEFTDNYFGYEDWTITKIFVILIKMIIFLVSPALFIIAISLSWYLYLSAKLDKLNGIMLTTLLKNLNKIRKVDSLVFLFTMESVSKINQYSSTVNIQLIKLVLHIACFFWITIVWMLSPLITIILAVLYPWIYISLLFDRVSFCLIKYIFMGFGSN